jgi:hypothetical protein
VTPTSTSSRALILLLATVALTLAVLGLAGCAPAPDASEGDGSDPADDASATGGEDGDDEEADDADGTAPESSTDAALLEGEPGDGNADVLYVVARQESDGTWTFEVTVEHPDTGVDDYADGWDVVFPDGTVYKTGPREHTRMLLHPHVDEQPFTRSQGAIVIPPEVTQVRVRAHDSVDGYGGREVVVDLIVASGEDFEVERLTR